MYVKFIFSRIYSFSLKMSKISYSNGIHSNQSSSSLSVSSEHGPFFTVCELANSGQDNQSLFLKLTDECSAAIRQAIKLRCFIRMHIRKQEAEIEIGGCDATSTVFKCSFQNQPETDSICFDPKENIYTNVGPANKTKLQVQATSKAFSDLKEKTQKLVEAEQQKKAKDMPKSPKKHKFPAGEAHRQMKTHASFLANFNKRTHSPSPVSNPRKVINAPPPVKQQRQAEANKNTIQPMRMVKNEMREKVEIRQGNLPERDTKAFLNKVASQTLSSVEPITAVKDVVKVIENAQSMKDFSYVPKRKQLLGAPSVSPVSTATSTPKTISPPLPVRPASVDSTLQHSSSCSPEDSIGSMAIPTKPSRDWAQEFAMVRSQDDAKRFHSIFKNEYPEYRRYHDDLTRVAEEFLSLKSTLVKTNDDLESQTVARLIREKLSNLQNDQQFMFKRQRHTDLHAKLNAIKKALEEWGKRMESDFYY